MRVGDKPVEMSVINEIEEDIIREEEILLLYQTFQNGIELCHL